MKKPSIMPRISIIIPARDEAANIVSTLLPLQAMRRRGGEIILVDGESRDDTPGRAAPLVDRVLATKPGRARQMNAGAQSARGKVLWFLHADTATPENADLVLLRALAEGRAWGRFNLRLSGQKRHPLLSLVARMVNLRSCLTGIATGDQGIFMEKSAFDRVGGFPEIPLMEDIVISRRLKSAKGRPACLTTSITTSSRRWEENGVLRTIFLMWGLRLAFFLGADPVRLARRYEHASASRQRRKGNGSCA
uniref:Transferase 2, rSAM/selenodomain-associated n=1 Tax=Candidatus Kentrum sp. SD TaxID=2126332 RepID=A0A450YMM6_9GAMM|nr:MAG: transferase 2, rSAM/selenodomain-associated [Candidatus Kentron sp. SD]VFK48414.1 MAG: transferase 2, rSAM/selenodomain-associated [Candidatus Kentron sp. SD]